MGAGFSLDAVNIVRNNRSLLKKRKFKDIKNLVIETSGKTELEFKQVSPEELALIKEKIRKKAKKSIQREITIYGIFALLLLIIAVLLIVYLFQ